jgi:hypothetical protein
LQELHSTDEFRLSLPELHELETVLNGHNLDLCVLHWRDIDRDQLNHPEWLFRLWRVLKVVQAFVRENEIVISPTTHETELAPLEGPAQFRGRKSEGFFALRTPELEYFATN